MRSFLFVGVFLFAAASDAISAEPATALAQPESASEPAVDLPALVVTAAASERPLAVTLDPKAPAQPIPAQDGADILKAIPGFSVIRKGGADGDPVFRGMAGSRLLVALDDQAVLGGCGNRMDPPTAYVFPAAYDRVTLLKGPQTVRHGPGNSAGVVLFERDRDSRETAGAAGGTAAATVGGFGRRDLTAVARGASPLLHVLGTWTLSRGDDYEDGAGRGIHAAHERWSAQAMVGWTPDAQTLLEISAARSDGEVAYADRAMDGVAFDRENVALRARRDDLTPVIRMLELQIGYNSVDHVMDNFTLRPFTPTAMMPGRAVSNPSRQTTGGRFTAQLMPGDARTRLTVGLDHQANDHAVRSTGNESADPYRLKPRTRDAEFQQWGVFSEVERDLPGGGRAVAGVRFDSWRAVDRRARIALGMAGSVPNPSAGHVRESQLAGGFARYERRLGGAGVTLYGGFGYVARFPDYWELVKNEGVTSASAFGTDPEKTAQLDMGAHGRAGGWELSAAFFASSVEDFCLVENNFPKPGGMAGTRRTTVTRSIDAATWGGEWSVGRLFVERWRADVSLAYTQGTNRTDRRPLAQIPPLEARVALVYARPTWSAGGLVRLVDEQRRVAVNQGNIVGQDIGPSEGFAVVSLHAAWRATDHLRLSAGVDNLLDENYAEHISRAGSAVAGYAQTTRVYEPGRMLWLKLDLAY